MRVGRFLLLLGLLLVASEAFSACVSVEDYNFFHPVIAVDVNGVEFNFSIAEDCNASHSVVSSLLVNGSMVDSLDFNIEPLAEEYYSLTWLDTNVAIEKGDFNVCIELLPDNNYLDYSIECFDVNVLAGRNLSVYSVLLDKNSYNVGETALVRGLVVNNGDSLATDFNMCYLLNDAFVACKSVISLSPGVFEPWDLNVVLPATKQANRVKLVVDTNDELNETDEQDNSKIAVASTLTGVDLAVFSDDITWSDGIREKQEKQFNAVVRNVGQVDASNVNVLVWVGSGSPENGSIVYQNTFQEVKAGQFRSFNFTYFPPATGYDTINVQVDKDDSIAEDNEENNVARKGFSIESQQSQGQQAHTIMLEISEKCISLLSNGDRVVSKGIFAVEGGFKVNLKLVDSEGKTLFEGDFGSGEERVLPGRTIRVISVSNAVAQVLLVYQHQVGLTYNTCYTDLENLMSAKKLFEDKYNECSGKLNALQSELDSIKAQRTGADTRLTTCTEELSTCKKNKDTVETTLATLNAGCDIRVSEAEKEQKENCNARIGSLNAAKEAEVGALNEVVEGLRRDLLVRNVVIGLVFGFAGLYLFYQRYGFQRARW